MAFPQIGNGRMLLHEMFADFFWRKLNHCTDDVFVCPFYDFYESELVLRNSKQEDDKSLLIFVLGCYERPISPLNWPDIALCAQSRLGRCTFPT